MASLKTELIRGRRFPNREAAKVAIFEYIESFYNRVRRHSSLGYLNPSDYEQSYNGGGCGGVTRNCPLPRGNSSLSADPGQDHS